VIVQGGAYGEHRIVSAGSLQIGGRAFQVNLAPGASVALDLTMELFAAKPSYAFPWQEAER